MRFIHQLSMSVKISFLAILGTALFGFAVVTSALSIVEKSMETQTFKSLDSTINYVHRLLETHGEHYVIKDDKLMIGDFVLSDNNDFVDELVRLNGDGAIWSVFRRSRWTSSFLRKIVVMKSGGWQRLCRLSRRALLKK